MVFQIEELHYPCTKRNDEDKHVDISLARLQEVNPTVHCDSAASKAGPLYSLVSDAIVEEGSALSLAFRCNV